MTNENHSFEYYIFDLKKVFKDFRSDPEPDPHPFTLFRIDWYMP